MQRHPLCVTPNATPRRPRRVGATLFNGLMGKGYANGSADANRSVPRLA